MFCGGRGGGAKGTTLEEVAEEEGLVSEADGATERWYSEARLGALAGLAGSAEACTGACCMAGGGNRMPPAPHCGYEELLLEEPESRRGAAAAAAAGYEPLPEPELR